MARADAGWTYQGVGIGVRKAGHMDRCDLMGSARGSSLDQLGIEAIATPACRIVYSRMPGRGRIGKASPGVDRCQSVPASWLIGMTVDRDHRLCYFKEP